MSSNWNRAPSARRGGIVDVLRNPVWAGITGVVAILSLCATVLALPQSAPVRAGISQVLSGAPAATSTPVPTATAAPPRVLTENLQIPCVSCIYRFDVVLDSITLDAAKQNMFWKFTLTNTDTSGIEGTFSTCMLEDPTTRTYIASGEVLNQFNLAAGASEDVTATFNYFPQTGVTYKLVLNINNNTTYQDESFTF
jgi:hypothetical protein